MKPEQANEILKGKIVEKLNFENPQGTREAYELLSVEFTDGTILELGGGYDGEVYGSILFPGGVEEGIREE